MAGPPMITRRQVLVGGLGFSASLAATGAYGVGIEPNLVPAVRRYAPTPDGWPDGLRLRIGIIADIHACEPWMSARAPPRHLPADECARARPRGVAGRFQRRPRLCHRSRDAGPMGRGGRGAPGAARDGRGSRQPRLVAWPRARHGRRTRRDPGRAQGAPHPAARERCPAGAGERSGRVDRRPGRPDGASHPAQLHARGRRPPRHARQGDHGRPRDPARARTLHLPHGAAPAWL